MKDSKSTSGISHSQPGTVSHEQKVVVRLPSDPSLRTSHPQPPSSSSRTAISEGADAGGGAIDEGGIHSNASTSHSKPPHVPFYDENAEARRRRQEPTAIIVRKQPKRAAVVPPSSAMMDDAEAGASSRSKGLVWLAIIALVLAGGVMAFVYAPRGQTHPDPTKTSALSMTPVATPLSVPPTPVPTSSASVSSAPSEPTTTSIPVTAPTAAAGEETVLSIETIPAHATILLGGAKVGVSPTEIRLPRSSDPTTLEIRHPGYVVLRERVVPDVNQRLKLTLMAAHTPPTKASAATYHKFE